MFCIFGGVVTVEGGGAMLKLNEEGAAGIMRRGKFWEEFETVFRKCGSILIWGLGLCI